MTSSEAYQQMIQQQAQLSALQDRANMMQAGMPPSVRSSLQSAIEQNQASISAVQKLKPEGKKSMFKEISTDVKGFIVEHRSIIYFVAVALIVDHFVFNGAFKTRLSAMAEKIVGKVEEKISNG